jgi:hypothetical protein
MTADPLNNTDLIDPAHTACLCDVGATDYIAATVVADDGTEHLILAERDSIGDASVRYDPLTAQAPHEQDGPLPTRYRLGLQAVPHRCGRPTKTTGRPCRIGVTRPGQACGLHRERTTR